MIKKKPRDYASVATSKNHNTNKIKIQEMEETYTTNAANQTSTVIPGNDQSQTGNKITAEESRRLMAKEHEIIICVFNKLC